MFKDAAPRILVVDDEPGVLETIAAILSREGYDVTAVTDVAQAIEAMRQSPFAVVLTDLRMEEVSGLTLVAHLRRQWPETTTVILTGYASLQSAIDAIREGVYDYLIKPCDVEELKATIARAVERSALARALRQRIAELDAANSQLSELNADMARRVEEATRELTQKLAELAEAKQRLEEERHQRERFISMVTHELRQPLTSLSASAQLLDRPAASPGTRDRARETILVQVRRMNRLIQDLADASRLSTGQFTLDRTRWDLVELLREQVELARVGDRSIAADLPPGPLHLEGDRDRVAQVISNLLSNATKYAPGEAVLISLRVDGEMATLAVRDHGPGIPADRLEAIFEPYVRLPGAEDSARPEGLGLGLYIARRIVEAHSGRIWAENGNPGATFVVTLPLVPVPASPVEPSAVRPEPLQDPLVM